MYVFRAFRNVGLLYACDCVYKGKCTLKHWTLADLYLSYRFSFLQSTGNRNFYQSSCDFLKLHYSGPRFGNAKQIMPEETRALLTFKIQSGPIADATLCALTGPSPLVFFTKNWRFTTVTCACVSPALQPTLLIPHLKTSKMMHFHQNRSRKKGALVNSSCWIVFNQVMRFSGLTMHCCKSFGFRFPRATFLKRLYGQFRFPFRIWSVLNTL